MKTLSKCQGEGKKKQKAWPLQQCALHVLLLTFGIKLALVPTNAIYLFITISS
jgi:hypothetical protein